MIIFVSLFRTSYYIFFPDLLSCSDKVLDDSSKVTGPSIWILGRTRKMYLSYSVCYNEL